MPRLLLPKVKVAICSMKTASVISTKVVSNRAVHTRQTVVDGIMFTDAQWLSAIKLNSSLSAASMPLSSVLIAK